MRGALQFFISIIYAAVIVMIIYAIFQAFIGAASLRDDSDRQLARSIRAVETRTTVNLEVKPEESVFIGSPDDSNCAARIEEIQGICDPGSLCICLSFSREGWSSICRSIPAHAFTVTAGDNTRSIENRCAWSSGAGMYTMGVEDENIVLRGDVRR